jgi:hypothetical protein
MRHAKKSDAVEFHTPQEPVEESKVVIESKTEQAPSTGLSIEYDQEISSIIQGLLRVLIKQELY